MKPTSPQRVLAVVMALTIGLVLAGSAGAATVQVIAQDFNFSPTPQTVAAGDTVQWFNNGNETHNVTLVATGENLGDFGPRTTMSKVFPTAGSFAYYCRFHGSASGAGMVGTIIVQGSGSTTTTTSTTLPPTTTTTTTLPPTTTTTTTLPPTTTTTLPPTTTTTTLAPTTTTTTTLPTTTTTTTPPPTTTTSTLAPTTSTAPTTSVPVTSTSLGPAPCQQLDATRARLNAQIAANQAAIASAGLPPDQTATLLAQLERVRADGNRQIDAIKTAAGCP